MFCDDARWKSIGQGVARFKPARRVILSDYDTRSKGAQIMDVKDPSPDTTSSRPIPSNLTSSALAETSRPLRGRGPNTRDSLYDEFVRKRAAEADAISTFASTRTKRTCFTRTKKGLNPAFKNPIAGYLRSGKALDETPRPQTAPDATILVPFTTSPGIRQSKSDATLLSDPQNDLALPAPFLSSCVEETSFLGNTQSMTESFETRPCGPQTSASSSENFGRSRYPPNQEQLEQGTTRDSPDDAEMTFCSPRTSINESETTMGTRKLAQPSKSAEQRGEESAAHSSRSVASTETPSSSSCFERNSSPLARKSTRSAADFVDLTGDSANLGQQVTRREVLGLVSSPARGQRDQKDPQLQEVVFDAEWNVVKKLPHRAECKAINTNVNRQFRSFIPDYLEGLATKYDLVNRFRPVQAPQCLRNAERGYWKMLISITDFMTVARSRRSPLTASQWSEKRFMLRQEGGVAEMATTPERDDALRRIIYSAKSPDTVTLWRIEEFVTFWKYLTKWVERGRAGFDSRATINTCTRSGDGICLEVRVWCYAEALRYIWLALYALSETLTEKMPLQWVVPGVGAKVVMSGQTRYGPGIGRWVQKMPGVDGSWGVEDDWEGICTGT